MPASELLHLRDEVLRTWTLLSEEDKSRLLPKLLDSMQGWHGWSISDLDRLNWLEMQFKVAGIPFRGQ